MLILRYNCQHTPTTVLTTRDRQFPPRLRWFFSYMPLSPDCKSKQAHKCALSLQVKSRMVLVNSLWYTECLPALFVQTNQILSWIRTYILTAPVLVPTANKLSWWSYASELGLDGNPWSPLCRNQHHMKLVHWIDNHHLACHKFKQMNTQYLDCNIRKAWCFRLELT
jgi:hypothetical protein